MKLEEIKKTAIVNAGSSMNLYVNNAAEFPELIKYYRSNGLVCISSVGNDCPEHPYIHATLILDITVMPNEGVDVCASYFDIDGTEYSKLLGKDFQMCFFKVAEEYNLITRILDLHMQTVDKETPDCENMLEIQKAFIALSAMLASQETKELITV